jgi:cytochrome P450/NADPH-cytochrome P450 reductase
VALQAIWRAKTGGDVAASARWIDGLGVSNRYVLDVWAGN